LQFSGAVTSTIKDLAAAAAPLPPGNDWLGQTIPAGKDK
jgi:hypothetical protein